LKGAALEEQFNESTMKFFVEALSRNEMFSQVEAAPQHNVSAIEYFTASLIVIFLMFAGMPGMKMLVTERSTGVTRRLIASPVRVWQIILSKLLVSVLLSAIQFSVIIILTSVVFKSYWGAPVKSILLLFAGIIFAVSAWSVFVSAIATTPASADIIGNLGILLMAIIGGSIYPLSSMPEFVRIISRFTITRWGMDGFMVVFSGNDALSVTGYVYPLLIMGLVLFGLATGIMKLARR
jgi:ABC-2 type transport system permease protein